MAAPLSSADLLLHPVRLGIVQSFLGGRELTVADLQAETEGVSPATVYRQVAVLAEAGVLEVVRERRIRGAVERTYRLRTERASISLEDLRAMTSTDHRRAFLTFVATLLGDFDRYVGSGDVDLERDVAGYRMAAFWATDDEVRQASAALNAALQPWLSAGPAPGRRRRLLATVLLPEGQVQAHDQDRVTDVDS